MTRNRFLSVVFACAAVLFLVVPALAAARSLSQVRLTETAPPVAAAGALLLETSLDDAAAIQSPARVPSTPTETAAVLLPTPTPGDPVQTDPSSVAPLPPLERPAAGQSYVDPVFGTTIRRVSDRGETVLGGYEVQLYSQLQAFSADNAYILLGADDGYRVRRVSDLSRVADLDLREINVPRWHPTRPHVLVHFDTNADEDATLQFTDVDAGVTTDVATLPGFVRISGNESFDELSRDGRWLAGLAYLPDESVVIFAWDMIANTYGAYLPLSDLYGGPCVPDPDWGAVWPDWIAPSPLGDYLVVQWARDGTTRCSGLETLDIRTGAFIGRVQEGHGHGDLGLSEDGRQFFMTFGGAPGEGGGNFAFAYYWLPGADPVAAPNYVLLLPVENWIGDHVSCQGPPGVCLLTTIDLPDNGQQPLEGELVLIRLDGSIQRLAHHRSSVCGYWAQPRATISHDGGLVAFSSDWGVAGCSADNDAGTADAYILSVPAETEGLPHD